ncbi:intermediate conductance calcium-activated potassium channel protein 4 [Spea bombifrons]|uniref:intermediate conductance calcium-activated potassium channel protein 4 n=1 Tax=Spea bombifrons TaxID=233779 RepID=UPI002349F50D|nr:intermediate conductance calcium-activated potassium channel protein 4 [Spea bombifrons]
MRRGGWPLFTTCLPASRGKSARSDMQTKELTEISILTSPPSKADIAWQPPSENLRKLKKRKQLVDQKKKLSAWTLFLALLGILLMVVHTELLWFGNCQWFVYLFLLKCSISLSTTVLIVLIITYHIKEIQLFMCDNSLVDWRIAVNAKKFAWILLEIVICAVHPFPSERQCDDPDQIEMTDNNTVAFLSHADILLSILMFLRVYLLPRTVLLHSRVLVDASYRSIGSLNKIKFQYQFVMKILMNTCPGRVLLILTISLWIVSSWVLSVCERENINHSFSLTKAMWLIPITFLTIGYGDLVPYTVCGKMVCLWTGVMGVGCTALIVAVAAQKLEFTKAEKHVHNFMMDIHYMKQIKCAAANVLGEAWLLHRHMKRGESAKIRQHQRRLLEAIHIFRRRRIRHKNLKDQVNAMVDISKMQMILCDLDSNLSSSHQDLEKRIDQLDKKLDDISRLIMKAIETPQLSQ